MIDRVMVDIETLGRDPGCAVIAIGAARFDTQQVGETFEASIDVTSCQEFGLEIDAETLEWWLSQGPQAREQLDGGRDLDFVLEEFAEFLDGCDEVWANSPKFDAAILEEAYKPTRHSVPWEYWQLRDFRTLRKLDVTHGHEQEGIEHSAVDDAVYQATIAATILGRIEREVTDD